MKIAAALLIGIVLGALAMHLNFGAGTAPESGFSLAALHGGGQAPQTSAAALMQTDTALCDQPYFQEVYGLSVDYFSQNSTTANAEEFASLLFDHARNSGHFNPEEAEAWIGHIKNIPGQLIEIYAEDSTSLDSCYNFQVAAVGPPQ